MPSLLARPTFFILISLCCLLCAGCAVRSVIPPANTLGQSKEQAVRAVLQHGDWLVTRGIHPTDNAVATATNMPLSHAALYDAERNAVIESEAQGVHSTPLDEFFAKTHRIMVLRPMRLSPENAASAVQRARALIGKGYNFAGLVGLNQKDRYYCTQVLIEAYKPYLRDLENPIPIVIKPGQMYHWARIIYDSGP